MNWFSKVEFCSIRVSKKGKHGVHLVVPFWGPHYGPQLGTTRIVYSENGAQKAPPFWEPFLKLFCFFFNCF